MKVAALDLAAATGIAIGEPGAAPVFWTEKLGDPDHRGMALMRIVSELIRKRGVEGITIEAPVLKMGPKASADTLRSLIGLYAVADAAARYCGVKPVAGDVRTVRKHFLGYNPKGREEAKRAVKNRCRALGWDVRDDNQADACALLDWRLAQLSPAHAIRTTALFQERQA